MSSAESSARLKPVPKLKPPKIAINAVTTKNELSQLLAHTGVLDSFAEIIRQLYEAEEEEWPENAEVYLLEQFFQRIPIVKQMQLMRSNFQKRIVELEDELNIKVSEATYTALFQRQKFLLSKSGESSSGTSLEDEDEAENTKITDDTENASVSADASLSQNAAEVADIPVGPEVVPPEIVQNDTESASVNPNLQEPSSGDDVDAKAE